MDSVPVIMKVKDELDNDKFAGVHENLPTPPALVLIIGSVRTGKSNLLVNLFCNPAFYKDKFDIVRIVSTTLHSDTKGKILDKFFNCSDHYEDSIINDIKKSQGAYKDKSERPTYALVLDDVLTKDFSKSNEVSFFATRFRHYIDMYVIATQTFRAVSGLIRNNATDIIIARQQNDLELKKISEEYSGLVGGEETFMKLYNLVHDEKYQLMYIKASENPVKVFKNFEVQIY
tara:strand:+ start:214 stop:906 length:693 start_codon:yes stop_codon:yes gene_type:complete